MRKFDKNAYLNASGVCLRRLLNELMRRLTISKARAPSAEILFFLPRGIFSRLFHLNSWYYQGCLQEFDQWEAKPSSTPSPLRTIALSSVGVSVPYTPPLELLIIKTIMFYRYHKIRLRVFFFFTIFFNFHNLKKIFIPI